MATKRKKPSRMTTLNNRKERFDSIKQKLSPLKNKSLHNKDLKEKVKITSKGINETAWHASKSKRSTLAAMDAKRQIKTAKHVKTTGTKGTRRQKEMGLVSLEEMRGKYNRNRTKVMLGRNGKGKLRLYSITAKK